MRLTSRTGLIATALAIGAIGAPSAYADPSHSGWNPALGASVVRPNPDQQAGELAGAAAAHKYSSTSSHGTARPRTATGSPGFQFDDAAVGGGVVAGVTLLGLAGAFAIRRRHELLQP